MSNDPILWISTWVQLYRRLYQSLRPLSSSERTVELCVSLFIIVLQWSHLIAWQSDVFRETGERAITWLLGGWRAVLAHSQVRIHKFEQRLPCCLLPQRFAPALFDWKSLKLQKTLSSACCVSKCDSTRTSVFSVLNKSSFEYCGRLNQIALKTSKQDKETRVLGFYSDPYFGVQFSVVTRRQQE